MSYEELETLAERKIRLSEYLFAVNTVLQRNDDESMKDECKTLLMLQEDLILKMDQCSGNLYLGCKDLLDYITTAGLPNTEPMVAPNESHSPQPILEREVKI